MNRYYTIEIRKIKFGEIRRTTVKAKSASEACEKAAVFSGERIVAVWRT